MTGTVAATLAARARRRIVDHFTSAGATLPNHAIACPEPGGRVERHIVRRMIAFGALRAAGEGTYWLDTRRLADFRKESLARVLGVLAVAGFAAAGAIAFGG
ncbi:hypothetical protein [Sphingomonas bacterium]|uniref:hypothetical protein n=1 Tax=Sphingomonas bacterium TaxID=1895847 RepID=UPI001576C4C7|nr:hypothetical protein [Sphingomonas bacterium]